MASGLEVVASRRPGTTGKQEAEIRVHTNDPKASMVVVPVKANFEKMSVAPETQEAHGRVLLAASFEITYGRWAGRWSFLRGCGDPVAKTAKRLCGGCSFSPVSGRG